MTSPRPEPKPGRPILAWSLNLGLIGAAAAALAASAFAPPPPVKTATPPARVATATHVDPLAGAPELFRAWLAANPAEAPRYQAFVAFLNSQGVGDILPPWQLVQSDTGEATARCQIAPYVVPPEEKWADVVPTLWLIKERIVPAVGPVRVLSGYRTPAANRCANGAEGSPHMSFSALDLQAVNVTEQAGQRQLFKTLCKVWYETPWSEGFGLGAYYVRNWPGMNEEGRFHVDTIGRRTWGHSYGAYTSHCRELGYIKVKSPEEIEAEEKAKLKAEVDAKLKAEADAKAAVEAAAKARADAAAKAEAERAARLAAEAAARKDAETAAVLAAEPEAADPSPSEPPAVQALP